MIYSVIGDKIVKSVSELAGVAGYGIGYQLPDGKIVKTVDDITGESNYVGITDDNGSYFYIRLSSDSIGSSPIPSAQKTGSCATQQKETIDLTFVGVFECSTLLQAETTFKKALIQSVGACKIDCMKALKIVFGKSYIHWMSIIKRETKGTKKMVWNSKNIKLISFDFQLTYIFDYCDLQNSTLCAVK